MLHAYGDGNIFGEPYGEGPVRVVWLHGWGRRGRDFDECATTLADRGVASVSFDLPGFGASPLPTVAGGARLYATLMVDPLRELAHDRLVLVGHSFGGRIATVLAATHPELVAGVVLTGAPILRTSQSGPPPLRFRVIRALHRRGMIGDKRMEAARQRFGSTDYRNASGLLRDVLVANVNESYEDELARILAPVAMVWGELDAEVPVAVAQRAQQLIHSENSLRVVNSVGHLLPREAPMELVTEVEKLLG
ncbi:MAG: alpha/beta fold hydrolase [Acidimicrobiales bacterium]